MNSSTSIPGHWGHDDSVSESVSPQLYMAEETLVGYCLLISNRVLPLAV